MIYQKMQIGEVLLQLVKLGIGHHASSLPENIEWNKMEELAAKHGLSAILVDGIGKLPESKRPPKTILLQWIGNILQNYEYRYELYRKAISEMAAWHNSNGFKMMVLKGYAFSLDWPKPNHRPCGDIDIWQFGMQKEADATLAKEKGIRIDYSHHHHTVLNWGDFVVENHYDFINIHRHKTHRSLELILKDLGKDSTHCVDVCGQTVYLPSPNLHALFIIRHLLNHFESIGINLRQLLDWAFYIKKHTKEIDWNWLELVLSKYNMVDFYNIINEICVYDLGFEKSIFPKVKHNSPLKERVLEDILEPEYTDQMPKKFFSRVYYKICRWHGSIWKHKLCFKESLWGDFWSGVWSHLLKPSSI